MQPPPGETAATGRGGGRPEARVKKNQIRIALQKKNGGKKRRRKKKEREREREREKAQRLHTFKETRDLPVCSRRPNGAGRSLELLHLGVTSGPACREPFRDGRTGPWDRLSLSLALRVVGKGRGEKEAGILLPKEDGPARRSPSESEAHPGRRGGGRPRPGWGDSRRIRVSSSLAPRRDRRRRRTPFSSFSAGESRSGEGTQERSRPPQRPFWSFSPPRPASVCMGRRVRKRKAGKGARGTDGWPLRCWEDGDPLKLNVEIISLGAKSRLVQEILTCDHGDGVTGGTRNSESESEESWKGSWRSSSPAPCSSRRPYTRECHRRQRGET